VEYYAYVRSLVIDGDLHFEKDWRAGNPTFTISRLDANGKLLPEQYTSTGYVANVSSVGPALLWAPFFVAVHLVVLGLNHLGTQIPADGYSRPYLVTLAVATAFYGFLGLLLAFRLARVYFEERWAFLATLGIWFATSLPVYMYFNPFWSHAQSAFTVALFLWYWHRTRAQRTAAQWALLGLTSGLMINVYYANGMFLLVPLAESLQAYWRAWKAERRDWIALRQLLGSNVLYVVATAAALLPTFITRHIIFGNPYETGYAALTSWNWTRPALWQVLFSSNHGLLAWTPIVIPALLGLVWLRRRDLELATYLSVAAAAFYGLIAAYPTWHGISSFGSRFFVSLTPVFVLGLACTLDTVAKALVQRRAFGAALMVMISTIAWNLGFIFQWGTHMVPPRGPISWREVAYNQVAVVPGRFGSTLKSYLLGRGALMTSIEQRDQNQIRSQQTTERK